MKLHRNLFAAGFTLLLTVGSLTAETWPQWLGPERNGAYTGTQWPSNLDALKPVWSQDLEPGYSSPIVSEKHVFTVETVDKKRERVRAWDRATGKEVWEQSWEGAMSVPFFARANGSWVRCTPAYDGESLFVGGMKDVLVCLDAKNGNERWRVDFSKRFESDLPSFGFVSSPLVHEGHVYVQAGGGFVKLDKKTGATVWRSLADGGGMYGSAFSSPQITTIHGRKIALVQTRTDLAGVDLETGKVLWKQPVKAFRGMNILTPQTYGDSLFTSTYGGRTILFDVKKDGAAFASTERWNNKLQGYMSTPVIVDGHAYLHLRNTRFACVDLENGEIKWTTTKRFGKYMSLVSQGDQILGLDQDGTLYLIKASPNEYQEIDSFKISKDETWAHIAIADGQLFVRELKGITVYRWGNPALARR